MCWLTVVTLPFHAYHMLHASWDHSKSGKPHQVSVHKFHIFNKNVGEKWSKLKGGKKSKSKILLRLIMLTWKFSAALGSPGFLSGWTILACKGKKREARQEIYHNSSKWTKGSNFQVEKINESVRKIEKGNHLHKSHS